MIIKKFQAVTETEAIMLAKEDLGKDAIVMNIKTIKPKGLFKIFRKTQVEVTAAVDENNDSDKKTESKTSAQFNDKINEKLHPEQKVEDEEAKALNEKLNSLAKLLEEQIESQKKETKSASDKKVQKDDKEDSEEKKSETDKKKDAQETKESIRQKSINLIMEQLTGNEVSYPYAGNFFAVQLLHDEIN